jgi:hypothetical protein
MPAKRNSDPHYFDCTELGCKGHFERCGNDTQEKPVYRCNTCSKMIGESILDRLSGQRRMLD